MVVHKNMYNIKSTNGTNVHHAFTWLTSTEANRVSYGMCDDVAYECFEDRDGEMVPVFLMGREIVILGEA